MPSQSWIVASGLSVEVGETAQLRVQLVGGSVTITGRAEPGVAVEIDGVVGNPLEVTASPSEVTIGYPTIGWDGWMKRLAAYRGGDEARVSLAVGPSTTVRVAAVSTQVRMHEVMADASVATATGSVSCEGLNGSLTARTVSGRIVVAAHSGAVRVNTVSGEVAVAGDVPRLDLAAVSGRCEVTTTRGTSVVRAQTVSGGLDVNVPALAGVDLKARTVSAPVMLDGVARRSGSGPGSVHVDERGTGEAAFIDVVTVTGPIRVSRGDAPIDE